MNLLSLLRKRRHSKRSFNGLPMIAVSQTVTIVSEKKAKYQRIASQEGLKLTPLVTGEETQQFKVLAIKVASCISSYRSMNS